ncbi:MAG: hypothetical protein KGL39_06515 [Patescibacteria group bacterium]|nr:hypothetical protein [Patescibacteria group bacterium]
MTYGQTIMWTDFRGDVTTITYSGFPTIEEARKCVIESAARQGWTPPKWWQYWRWNDTRLNSET